MKALLFNVWWLVMLADGFICFACARGFWGTHRRGRRRGERDRTAFWTAALFFCLSAESFGRGLTAPFTSDPSLLAWEALWIAFCFRTVKGVGIWLWWLKVFKPEDPVPPTNGVHKTETPG